MQVLNQALKGQVREGTIYFAIMTLILNMSFLSVFFVPIAQAEGDLCDVPVDMVLVMDRSGSMVKGDCTYFDRSLDRLVTEENVTRQWCENQDYLIFEENDPTSLESAQEAASTFLDLMGSSDQSALVSFATVVDIDPIDKELSNNHNATEIAINVLSAEGATNIGAAIAAANSELGSVRANPEAVQAMILLTDGRANKPDGTGSGEHLGDVQYAKDQADIAASNGFKIFTIGLGDDVNVEMLEYIANVTGGEYYPSGQENLEVIYGLISVEVCKTGSISGCKWLDENGDGEWVDEDIQLEGWEIVLDDGEATSSQLTGEFGCYQFSGLEAGTYTLTEVITPDMAADGWTQTWPNEIDMEFKHVVVVGEGENVEYIDFGNYQITGPVCGNGEPEGDEECDAGENNGLVCIPEYGDVCNYCSEECTEEEVVGPYCGDAVMNGEEECDGEDGVGEGEACTQECTIIDLGDCGNGDPEGDEQCDDGEDNGLVCTPEYGGSCSYCSLACEDVTVIGPYCGDNETNGDEDCDDGPEGSSSCTSECIDIGGGGPDPECGDGQVNQTSEQCDDGNTENGDGCSASCQNEGGGGPSPYCGDGIKNQSSEECDGTDGIEDAETCNNSCEIEELGNNTLFPTFNFGGAISNPAPAPSVLGEEGAPVLVLEKTIDALVANPGDKDIRFRVEITNTGNITAFNVVLNDILPAGLSFADQDEATKTWELGDLAPGNVLEVTYMVDVDSDASDGIYANSAEASADNHGPVTASVDLEVGKVAVLAETGFSTSEFMILMFAMLSMAGGALTLKRKYTI